jgi:heme-degrading monooxygenase HmoA
MRSTAWRANRRAIRCSLSYPAEGWLSAAALRRQSRHRQSPPSAGIGSFAVSSAHQQVPDRLQLNSVPQPEQASRRGGFANGFVIKRAEPSWCSLGRVFCPAIYAPGVAKGNPMARLRNRQRGSAGTMWAAIQQRDTVIRWDQEIASMYIAMNRFRVAKGSEAAFEQVWMSRDSHLDKVPGFVEFHLLKGPEAEDHTLYASHTIWENHAVFEAWTKSEAFRAAHHKAGDNKPLYLGHPQFEGFEVRQTVGHGAK